MRRAKNIMTISILTFCLLLVATSCAKEIDGMTREELDIQKFITDRNIVTVPNESGLYYIEQVAGQGETPIFSDTLEVYYKGMFLDGRVFDANLSGDPFSFPLGEGKVILGWDEGLSYMKPGGKAMLIIPSRLGYGTTGAGTVPGSTPLLFEIELLNVKPGPNH